MSITQIVQSLTGVLRILLIAGLLTGSTLLIHPPSATLAQLPDAIAIEKSRTDISALLPSAEITVCPGGGCDYDNVQDAIDAAASGDVIKIAAGVYTDTDTASAGYLAQITQTLTLRGGYDAAFSEPPDPNANPTVLDGEYQGHVVVIEGSAVTVTLTGLTLRQAGGSNVQVTDSASLVITSSRVLSATEYGLYLEDAGPSEVRDSVIAANGDLGLEAYYTHLTVIGNTLTGNNGGIYLQPGQISGPDTIIEGNTLLNNVYGGVYVSWCYSSNVILTHNIISGHDDGVHTHDAYDNLTLIGNTITGNEYGVYIAEDSNVRMDNNIVARNTQAGVYVDRRSHPILRHNTLSDNLVGVQVRSYSSISLTNTIIASSTYGIQTTHDTAVVTANHTLWYANTNEVDQVEDSTIERTNDIYGDPRFIGGADPFDAYHVDYNSAAIDAGIVTGLLVDIDGEPRAPDIGADEYPHALSLTPDHARPADPDSTVIYTHTLRNSGSAADTFSLTVASDQGWTVDVAPLSVPLNSGATAPVTVTLIVPPGASIGQVDTTIVTATAQADARVFATAHDVTTVGVGVRLAPDRSANLDSGASWVYTHTLTNLGSVTDDFDLMLADPLGWASLLSASPITLAAGATATVEVQVTVPLTGATGAPFTAILTATSQTAPYPSDAVADSTWVNPVPGDRYLSPSGSDLANNCTDSAAPCARLRHAVGQAQPGNVIKVAAGVYTDTETASAGYLARIDQSLTVRGGYDAAFTEPPDSVANPSLLDGDYQGQVIVIEGSDITVTLTGLTLQQADGNNVYVSGGASLVITSSRVISATERGIRLDYAGPSEVHDNIIAANDGAGMEVDHTRLTATGNTLTDNFGGMDLDGRDISGVDTLVEGNTLLDNSWSGIYTQYWLSSTITLAHNIIDGHEYGVYGYYTYDHATLTGNTITGNEYGVYLDYEAHARLDNNIIAHNTQLGVYASHDSDLVLRHNTLSDNPTGVHVGRNSAASLTNTIITSSTYGVQTTHATAAVTADHTLWHANTHNTDLAEDSTIERTGDVYGDPRFFGGADPFDAYHIAHGSAAIDAGRVTGLLVDIDGEPRAPDIGADEYPHAVRLTPDHDRITVPDTTIIYMHTLRNSGTSSDTFSLDVASDQEWTVDVEPLSATLNSGETAPVTVTLIVPPGTPIGQVDTTVVTATAQADARVLAAAHDVTTVGVGVRLTPDRSATLGPGGSWVYTHTLTNLGSIPDTFDLVLTDPLGWASLLTASPIPLAASATATIEVQVTVPLTGAAGGPFTAILTATSQAAPHPSDAVTDSTWVNPVPGNRYLSPFGSDAANNCTDPATPCAHLRHTVEQSWPGDVIRIATGVYTETDTAIADHLAQITQTLTLRGGYDAAFSEPPDPAANPSVLDGEYQGQVVVIEGSGITVTLSGLTLQRGNGDESYRKNNVCVSNGASLVITSSHVISATEHGIRMEDAGPSEVRDNVIAANGKAGLYAEYTRLTATGNTLTDNWGGMELFAWQTSGLDTVVEGNILLNNDWGGLYVDGWHSSTITLAHNIISGHEYGVYGYYTYDNLMLDSNTITGNEYGVYLDRYSHARLDNNILAHNTDAGVYAEDDSNPILRHNTLFDNFTGVWVHENSTVSLTNTIIASSTYGVRTTHATAAAYADHTLWHANANYADSSAGGTIQRTNDVYGDPRFLGGADPFDAYHIAYDSAAVEAGINAGLAFDIDGDPRPRVPGRAYAIGADERVNLPPVADASSDQSVDANATIRLNGSASFAPNGDYPLAYLWAQTGGPAVTLSSQASVSPTFTAPFDSAALTFTLVVTDSLGLASVPDEVVIVVELHYVYLPLVLRQ